MAPGISDAIKTDLREIESYYENIIESSGNDEQQCFPTLFTWGLARHYIGEELVVYPFFEKLLIDGIDMADKGCFETMTSSDTNFIPAIKKLMENLYKHNNEEEIDHLPRLEEFLTQE
ncbi:uncharacterized protein N7511_001721 [Penicillium nucicola]|uniref:uncharacterized protein n=1 Tax=Penicillium nucicola TaxID=1850975 RepID=UPI00254538F0|nr:uncharacterized protein N7511_001721 [Penicillium nucicola]KAJ5776710.1 hypothetical protein N7511_001721 [Penicillium nucicola]